MKPASLRNAIKGEVLEKSDPAYESTLAGLLWNQLRSARRPDLIVRVRDEHDVVKAMNFADHNNLRVVARGGGHSWSGLAVRDGGMLIDLQNLNQVTVDSGSMRASIQPFVSNREIITHLEPYGLAFPTGHCPTVKVSGYLLSGGIGWNAGFWSHACHSVEAIDIVTAQGELVRADNNKHAELFWAARGGGAGFPGIAVRYHVRVYPLPKAISGSSYYFPLEHIQELGNWAWDVADKLPSWVEFSLFMLSAPAELRSRCTSMNGKLCRITATAFADDSREAANALALLEDSPLRKHCLASELNQPSSFSALFDGSGAMWPEKMRSRVETLWSNSPPGEMLLAARDYFISSPSASTLILVAIYPEWASGVPTTTNTAFSMCAKVYGGLWTMWQNSTDDFINSQWHDKMMSVFKPFTIGHYLGETDIVDDPNRATASFTIPNWERLQRIRSKFDPKRLFQGFDGGL